MKKTFDSIITLRKRIKFFKSPRIKGNISQNVSQMFNYNWVIIFATVDIHTISVLFWLSFFRKKKMMNVTNFFILYNFLNVLRIEIKRNFMHIFNDVHVCIQIQIFGKYRLWKWNMVNNTFLPSKKCFAII